MSDGSGKRGSGNWAALYMLLGMGLAAAVGFAAMLLFGGEKKPDATPAMKIPTAEKVMEDLPVTNSEGPINLDSHESLLAKPRDSDTASQEDGREGESGAAGKSDEEEPLPAAVKNRDAKGATGVPALMGK